MKLHEDEHSVTSISDLRQLSQKKFQTMIVNSSNSLSRGKPDECPNVMCSYLATIQNNNKYTKSNLNVLHLEKKMMLPR